MDKCVSNHEILLLIMMKMKMKMKKRSHRYEINGPRHDCRYTWTWTQI